MRRLHPRQAGDTLVEVLISIAVVSLVLAVSYGTANHNVRTIQDAQERSQAMQLIQRQIEFLRANRADEINTGTYQCFGTDGNPYAGGTVPSDPCTVGADGAAITDTAVQPQYNIAITASSPTYPAPVGTVYTVTIQWPSVIDSTRNDNVTMYYRP